MYCFEYFFVGLFFPRRQNKRRMFNFVVFLVSPASCLWNLLGWVTFDFCDTFVTFIHLGSVHTWCPVTVSKYSTHWAPMWTHSFFKHTHARIRARCRCPLARSRSCARARKWTLCPCVQQFLYVPGIPLLCSRYSVHVSKRSLTGQNGITMYTVSHISGTQSVNATPFCAGTQVLVPEHQVWAAPKSYTPDT